MYEGMLKIPYRNIESDRAAYEAWFKEGSLSRARDVLEKKGILTSKGRPFASDAGVRQAAIRYMIFNYDETKQKLLDSYKEHGYAVEEKFIERYMIKSAVKILMTPERIKFWLIGHNLLEKHRKFIESLVTIPDD